MSLAEFIIVGPAGDKAHVHEKEGEEPYTRFSLSVHRGRNMETTQWFDVVCFGKAGERAATIEKGDRVFARGRIELEVIGDEGERKHKRASFIASYLEVYTAKQRLPREPGGEG